MLGYRWKNVDLNSLDGEIWLDINGWDGLYQVSNFCRIKSLKRVINFVTLSGANRHLTIQSSILKPYINSHGYPAIKLYHNSKSSGFLIHRIVALAFIPNHENKSDVNHKNGIRDFMDIDNFEWVTRSENHIHKYRVLKSTHPFLGRTGKMNSCSVKTSQIDPKNNTIIKIWDSMNDIQRDLGFFQANISACCRGKQKTAYNFKWEYYVN